MIQRMPSFRGIEAFVHLAETGGIRAAARAMNLSVSAVSHRLRVLEAEIGAPLFQRGSRELRLTPAALAFHAELQPIIQDMLAAASRLAQSGTTSTLSVSADSVIISSWINSRFGNWQKRMPDVNVSLHSSDAMASPHSDINIRISFREDARPGEQLLFDWTLTPFCHPRLVSEYGLKTPEDLCRAPLIDVNRPIGGWRNWLAAAGLAPGLGHRALMLDTYTLMLDTATRGHGVMIGATAMAQEYQRRGLIMPFSITCKLPGGTYVNGPTDHESIVARAFREWLLEEAAVDTTL